MRRLLQLLPILLLLAACTQVSSLNAPADPILGLRPDTSGRKPIGPFLEAIEARRAAGDTALTDVRRLRGVLPDSIAGFRREIVLADTLRMSLMELSEAKKVFYDKEGRYIELILTDYIRDPDFMAVNLHRHNLADSVEVQSVLEERRQEPGLFPSAAADAFAWSTWNKARQSAYLHIALDRRYLLSIDCTPSKGPIDPAQAANWLRWDSLFVRL